MEYYNSAYGKQFLRQKEIRECIFEAMISIDEDEIELFTILDQARQGYVRRLLDEAERLRETRAFNIGPANVVKPARLKGIDRRVIDAAVLLQCTKYEQGRHSKGHSDF